MKPEVKVEVVLPMTLTSARVEGVLAREEILRLVKVRALVMGQMRVIDVCIQ